MLIMLLFVIAFVAGVQNALAGGGSFLTFPALLMFGMGARAANVTSTVALFPGQIASGVRGWGSVAGVQTLSFPALAAISLVGGALGAVLLLETPESIFQRVVPFLVLFATAVFAWRSFGQAPDAWQGLSAGKAAAAQTAIAIYGGYFGGGIGILMLAALIMAGQKLRVAGATKNMLAGLMNASAVAIFAFSRDVHWFLALVMAVGAIAGGQLGAWMMTWVNERTLQLVVVGIGLVLTVAMFIKAYA